jgi:hypothetical protein
VDTILLTVYVILFFVAAARALHAAVRDESSYGETNSVTLTAQNACQVRQ